MWLDESPKFKHLKIEAVRTAQEQLQFELSELKKEIEINELVHGIAFVRPFTSVPIPNDAPLLACERKLYIEKLLQVHDVRKPYIQADIIQEEIDVATKSEYTPDSLPILLHQVRNNVLFFRFKSNCDCFLNRNLFDSSFFSTESVGACKPSILIYFAGNVSVSTPKPSRTCTLNSKTALVIFYQSIMIQ